MSEHLLHDKEIREPLFFFLEETYGKIRIIEEKMMGRSRADIVMVIPSALVGIEIKSDADSYARLAGQVKDYDRFFDYNIVAVGSHHVLHIEEHVPAHWGIITIDDVDGTADFYILRKPQRNPADVLAKKLALLWRPELVRLQEAALMPRYAEKSKRFVQRKILETYAKEDLHKSISELLMERDYTSISEEIETFRASRDAARRRAKTAIKRKAAISSAKKRKKTR